MKSTIVMFLCSLLLLLVGCASELPPEPEAPGAAGNYYKSVGDWAIAPQSFDLLHNENLTCAVGETVDIGYTINGDDFSYRHFYIWDDVYRTWEKHDFTEGSFVDSSKWIRGTASHSESVLCEELLSMVDENNEIFAAAYACSFENGYWDCHDNKWQLEVFNVIEVDPAPVEFCIDSDDGVNYGAIGTVSSLTENATDSCYGDNLIEYSCSDDLQVISEEYTCDFGCFEGACIGEPDEVQEPVTFNSSADSESTQINLATAENLFDSSAMHQDNPISGLWDDCVDGSAACSTAKGDSQLFVEFAFGDVRDISEVKIFGDTGGSWISEEWSVKYKENISDSSWITAFSNRDVFFDSWDNVSVNVQAQIIQVDVTGGTGTQVRELQIIGTNGEVYTGSVSSGSSSGGSLSGGISASSGGMLWTPEEVAIWKERAENGPYKVKGDSYDPWVPGEWERIKSQADRFRSNPRADRFDVLGDTSNADLAKKYSLGNWDDVGWTAGGWRAYTEHADMLGAAFYALVKNDSDLARLVVTELVHHASLDQLQTSRTAYSRTDKDNWWQAAWLMRMVVAADFVKPYFTDSELQQFNSWIQDWGYQLEYSINKELSSYFPDRYNRIYSTSAGVAKEGISLSDAGCTKKAYITATGEKKNDICSIHRVYNNRKATRVQTFGHIGAFVDDEILKDRAKLYVEEWIKFSIFPDGSPGEFERNSLSREHVAQGYSYNAINLEVAVTIADVLARAGDTSLYEFKTADGRHGNECPTSTPCKDLKLAIDTQVGLMLNEIDWYVHVGSHTNPYHHIDPVAELIRGTVQNPPKQWVSEVTYAVMANRYYKDSTLQQAYLRTHPNSIALPTSTNAKYIGQPGPYWSIALGPWMGNTATYPSLLFMHAEMENQVNPYS